jgi:hypothetical protein
LRRGGIAVPRPPAPRRHCDGDGFNTQKERATMKHLDKTTQTPVAPASFPLAVKSNVKAGNLTLARPSISLQTIRVLPGRLLAAPA